MCQLLTGINGRAKQTIELLLLTTPEASPSIKTRSVDRSEMY
uniref:Uncharacterized protein n=1 Tax=Peronospora matthiolae TaxID=2874970 RepID=A0AAV1UWC9_9STRA